MCVLQLAKCMCGYQMKICRTFSHLPCMCIDSLSFLYFHDTLFLWSSFSIVDIFTSENHVSVTQNLNMMLITICPLFLYIKIPELKLKRSVSNTFSLYIKYKCIAASIAVFTYSWPFPAHLEILSFIIIFFNKEKILTKVYATLILEVVLMYLTKLEVY